MYPIRTAAYSSECTIYTHTDTGATGSSSTPRTITTTTTGCAIAWRCRHGRVRSGIARDRSVGEIGRG